MIEFVKSGGVTIQDSKAIYVKNAPVIVQPIAVGQEDPYKGLTPKERLAKRKEEEATRKMEEHMKAAKDAKINYQKA